MIEQAIAAVLGLLYGVAWTVATIGIGMVMLRAASYMAAREQRKIDDATKGK